MALILLRHTRPVGAAGLCYGRTDLAVADDFDAEVLRLTADLPRIAQIVTSPLTRTAKLARAIGAASDLPVREDDRLVEMDFGAWEGLAWEAIPRAELDAWADDLMHARPHGGESVAMLAARVGAALSSLDGGDTLVVTHAGVVRAALARAGRPDPWSFKLDYGAWVTLPG